MQAGVTGGVSGTGTTSITGTLSNSVNTAGTATYTVTPTSSVALGSCLGATFLVTITVNPVPAITTTSTSACSAALFTATPANVTNGVVPANTQYSWTAPTMGTGVGGGVSGTGTTSITGTLTNSTSSAQTATYTVTPTSSVALGSCPGATFTVVVTVNPKPAINAMATTTCSSVGFTVTPVDVTNGVVPLNTTYTWTAPTMQAGITGGVSGSGTNSITGTLTSTLTTTGTATYTVTPTSSSILGSCTGAAFVVTVTVNPAGVAPVALANVTMGPVATVNGTALLADGNITASPGSVSGFESYRGRVFNNGPGNLTWKCSSNTVNSGYMLIDLGSIQPVNGIATQGSGTAAEWVTSYSVFLSLDNVTYFAVPGTGTLNTFTGNSDQNTVVTNMFGQYHARYVKIMPQVINVNMSMRAEVISIPEGTAGSAQTVNLAASIPASSTSVRWWTAASGGTLLTPMAGTNGQVLQVSISANTTYYVEGFNASTTCVGSARTPVIARVNNVYWGYGPGGVGNTVGTSDMWLWLDATQINQNIGSAITTSSWVDKSGSGTTITGVSATAPTLQTSAGLNSQNAVRFVQASSTFVRTGNIQGSLMTAGQTLPYTLFNVAKYNATTTEGRVVNSNTNNWLMGWHSNFVDRFYATNWVTGTTAGVVNGACQNGTGVTAANTNGYIYTAMGNKYFNSLYSNNARITNQGYNCGLGSPQSLCIGAYGNSGGTTSEWSDADVSEIIYYDRILDSARRNIISNYLSSKYGVAISLDYYDGDLSANGTCNVDVSGIGREVDGWHTMGQSGGLYLADGATSSLSANTYYMMYGHNATTGGFETSNLPVCGGTNPSKRLTRIWWIKKTGMTSVGQVSLTFNWTDLGLPGAPATTGNWQILYRAANGAGNFAVVAGATGVVSGNTVVFSNVNISSLANGQYTLGYNGDVPGEVVFTGSNSVQVTSSAALQIGTGNFSYEFWVYPTSFTSNNVYFENGNATIGIKLLQTNSTTIGLFVNGGSLGTLAYAPTLNTWTDLALVRSGTNVITLYANGVSVGTFTASAVSISPTTALLIGNGTSTTTGFIGDMDEFRFWNVALTAANITANWHLNINNATTTPAWTNLQAYYKFNEPTTSTVVYDLSQNNNNGTLVSGAALAALYPATNSSVITSTGSLGACTGTSTSKYKITLLTNARLSPLNTYTWSVTGASNSVSGGAGTANITVTWGTAGTQTVSCAINHSDECYTETATYTVTVTTSPVLTPTLPTTMCSGGSTLQFTATTSPNAVNPWVSSLTSIASITSGGLATGLSNGATTITYTDVNNCTASGTLNVSTLAITPTATVENCGCTNGTNFQSVVTVYANGGVNGNFTFAPVTGTDVLKTTLQNADVVGTPGVKGVFWATADGLPHTFKISDASCNATVTAYTQNGAPGALPFAKASQIPAGLSGQGGGNTIQGSYNNNLSNSPLAVNNAANSPGISTAFVNGPALTCHQTAAFGSTWVTYIAKNMNSTTGVVNTNDSTNNTAVLEINSNGQNLDSVAVSVYREPLLPSVPNRTDANSVCYQYPEYAMERHFVIQSNKSSGANSFPSNVGVRLYFSDAELEDLMYWTQRNAALSAGTVNAYCASEQVVNNTSQLFVTKYTGANEDGDYTNNLSSGYYRMYGPGVTTLGSTFTGLDGTNGVFGSGLTGFRHYVEFNVREFSEFWLHGSGDIEPLPVEMIYFEAEAINNEYIQLSWATDIEINNKEFQVERSVDGQNWTHIGTVDGHGNSTVKQTYTYNDVNVIANTRYYYRLKQVDFNLVYKYTSVVTAEIFGNGAFNVSLSPNPTYGTTNLIINTTNDQAITVDVYNVIGQKMASSSSQLSSGYNRIELDLGHLASGTYMVSVTSANQVYTKKLVIAK